MNEKLDAQREAQELANQTNSVHLVFINGLDRNPVYQICEASEAWAYMGDCHLTVSRHPPKRAA